MVNWNQLKHHRGVAGDIPQLIADMIGGPDTPVGRDARFNHHLTLQDRLFREGQWVEATPAALELLFASMTDDAQERHRLVWHISLLTSGGVNHAMRGGLPLSAGDAPFQRAALDVTLRHEDTLQQWLMYPEDSIRSLSARLLGWLPQADAKRVADIEAMVSEYPNSLSACNGVLALGFLARHQKQTLNEPLLKACMRETSPPTVRAGAALAWAWNELTLDEVVLAALLSIGFERSYYPDELDWSLTRQVLPWLPAARAFKEALAVRWMERWNQGPAVDDAAPASCLLAMLGSRDIPSETSVDPAKSRPRSDVTQFSEVEQTIIRLSAHPSQLGTPLMPGVPDRWRVRRRWLGLDTPTLLEATPPPWEPEVHKAVWDRWWDHIEAGELDDWGLPLTWTRMTDRERLELVCEAKVNAYSLCAAVSNVKSGQVQELLAKTANDADVQRWALPFLSDLGRLRAQGLGGLNGATEEYALPLLRALWANGVETPQEIDALLKFDDRDDLELIRKLPLDRRRAILLRERKDWRTYDFIVPLLDVYPFHDYASVALNGINESRGKGGAHERKGNRFLAKVVEAAAQHPELAAALADARARPDWVPEQ